MSASLRRTALRWAMCLVLAAAVPAACSPSSGDGSSFPERAVTVAPTASAAPSAEAITAPTEADWARVGESLHLIDREASKVWAGWAGTAPVILGTERHEWVVTSPSGVDGLTPVAGLEVEGREVYRRPTRLAPGVGVRELPDGYAVAVLPRAEMQALVDDLLGRNAITLDDVQYVRWLAHEMFHVFQLETTSGQFPRYGFDGSEAAVVEQLTATPGHLDAVAREGDLLVAVLTAESEGAATAEARRFLAIRAQRRSTLDAEVVAFERAVEWSEGLARYADVRLLQAAGAGYVPSAPFAALGAGYPNPESTWAESLGVLADLPAVPGTLRDWHYALGAAQAYALDRLMPGWHERALPGGESLEDLLAEAVAEADADEDE